MDAKKIRTNNIIKFIGLILIAISCFMFIYNYANHKKLDKQEEIKIEDFFKEEISTSDEVTTPTESTKEEIKSVNYNYIAVLEIPSINLKRGLVDPSSKYNNVNYNIQILNSSTMPNVTNGNLILAGHNGASYISFFKNLHKLNINDKVYLYYNGVKYEYLISKYYDTNKDGNVEIYRDQQKTTITLITCKKNAKDKQVVYIGYLNSEVSY